MNTMAVSGDHSGISVGGSKQGLPTDVGDGGGVGVANGGPPADDGSHVGSGMGSRWQAATTHRSRWQLWWWPVSVEGGMCSPYASPMFIGIILLVPKFSILLHKFKLFVWPIFPTVYHNLMLWHKEIVASWKFLALKDGLWLGSLT